MLYNDLHLLIALADAFIQTDSRMKNMVSFCNRRGHIMQCVFGVYVMKASSDLKAGFSRS